MIKKYPNSLGKHVDPVDIHIKVYSKGYENSGNSGNSRASSRDPWLNGSKNGVLLSPAESVFEVMDRFFPNGVMAMHDAFVITISQPTQQSLQVQPSHVSRMSSPQHDSSTGVSANQSRVNSDELPLASSPSLTSQIKHESTVPRNPSPLSFARVATQQASTSKEGLPSISSSHDHSRDSPNLAENATRTNIDFGSFESPLATPANPSHPFSGPASFLNVSQSSPTSASFSTQVISNTPSSNTRANKANGSKRKSLSATKPGNGVILLPRQFKNQSTSFGQRKGISRLTIDTSAESSSELKSDQQIPPPSPLVPHAPGVPSFNEIHHTKTGAYQRVKPSSAPNLSVPSGTGDGSTRDSPLLSQREEEGMPLTSTSLPIIKQKGSDEKDKKSFSSSFSSSSSQSKARPPGKVAIPPSHAKQARESRSSSGTDVSKNPPTNNISNNRQLLLSINKGISPYTTVVPQVNVLIVEDNVINQRILETYLRKRKIRSSTAKNGREAIEKWRQGGFHLVLMDIQLPVMNGIEATKKIRSLENKNRIGVFSSAASNEASKDAGSAVTSDDILDVKKFRSPVIIVALTASSSLADKSEALAAGCNDFLTKPVNLKWLEQKTIEWGCMQALIDFEGWKHWVSKESILQPAVGPSLTQKEPLPSENGDRLVAQPQSVVSVATAAAKRVVSKVNAQTYENPLSNGDAEIPLPVKIIKSLASETAPPAGLS